MLDQELLMAMSDMMDEKLSKALSPVTKDIQFIKEEQREQREELKAQREELKAQREEQKAQREEQKAQREELRALREEQTRMNLIIENEIRTNIRLLVENYVPAAQRFTEEADRIACLEVQVKLLNEVVADHSEILQKIS